MAIVLPPSYVGAESPYFGSIGLSPNQAYDMMAQSAGYWLLMQQQADEYFRADMYKQGDWKSALNSALSWNEYEARGAFEKATIADYMVAKGLKSIGDAIWANTPYAEIISSSDGELSGGVYTPVAALYHSFMGGGTPMWTNLNNLGLDFEVSDFPQIQNAMESAGQGVTGLYIDKVAYSTEEDSIITGAFLGNITLKVEGEITKVGDHATFTGTVKGWDDTYDANASIHRSELAEHATELLNIIQTHTPAAPYQIQLVGEVPINLEWGGE